MLIYLGWQIYSGNTKYYQLLYGQVLGKKDKDEYIAKHHQSFGILYIVVGIVIVEWGLLLMSHFFFFNSNKLDFEEKNIV